MNKNLNQKQRMMTSSNRFRSLFRSLYSSVSSYTDYPERYRYIFRYYSEHLPYLPLPFVLSRESIIPVALKTGFASGRSRDYKTMIYKTLSPTRDNLTQYHTRGNNWFAVGPGCMYAMPNIRSTSVMPIFVMTLPHNRYRKQDRDSLIANDKRYMEVFFHHHIRSVNSTLWRYIRNLYIPLLQLEGVSFQFKHPNEIMELTTTTYRKPKFESLDEMKEYKEQLSQMCSLKNVFSETGILNL